ncbi:MAG: Wzz/FepE/Etk N-terminal domain-containing protein [Acidobacteriaceae bacterium]
MSPTSEMPRAFVPLTMQESPLHEIPLHEIPISDRRAGQAERLRLLWEHRQLLARAGALGLVASALLAFLIPRSYTSTTQLMPPDSQSNSSLAMMASMAAKSAGGLGSMAADFLGVNSTGALFVGILRSDTAQVRLVDQFDLKKVYGKSFEQDARSSLDQRTLISEDRKSGIISISVTDRSSQRAAALARAYVDQLNSLIAELSISSAHRERVFLEERLKVAKHDLDQASNELAQFSSQNSSVDVQTMGKAALDAAGRVAGELIAAQSQLEGLRQIYSDNNSRIRSLEGRISELRKQLENLDGTGVTAGLPLPVPATGMPVSDVPVNDLPVHDIPANDMPYPSLRNLPWLGVKYADYYRRAKIQETVYQLLTEQYELAKIQEVKETPVVKVLDQPKVAERKSSPPRMLITLLGTLVALGAALVWVVGEAGWQAGNPRDPLRILAQEVAFHLVATLKARTQSLPLPWRARRNAQRESQAPADELMDHRASTNPGNRELQGITDP